MPAKIDRERYFRELTYLELSALFAGPLAPGPLARWAQVAPKGAVGLVAPFSLTHRKPPRAPRTWPHDATTGDFRDSATSRAALGPLRDAVAALGACCVVFRSPEGFSPSAANRDLLRRFFGEVAPVEALGGAPRVWVPGGLWEIGAAAKLANELAITCAIDPLTRQPGDPLEIFLELDVPSLYVRIERAGTLRSERLDELAELADHYEGRLLAIAFATQERWQDARNLKKLLDGG